MHSKFGGSLAGRLIAAALLLGLAASVLPGTVNAAGLDQTALWMEETVVTQQVAGVVEQNRRTPYIRTEQYKPQWQPVNPAGQARTGDAISTDKVVRSPEMLEVSQMDLNSIWHCPLALDTFVSSPFGMRRHPVYGNYRMHEGVDLDSDQGDPVLAARGGVVVKVGYSSGAGRYIRIDHGDGFITDYYHLSRQLVEEGQKVYGGEVIGKVGNTGVSTGAHLHFGIKLDGEWVDPEDYIDFD